MPKPKKKLTDVEWEIVFRLRCRSKQGGRLSREESALMETAFYEDPGRYGNMQTSVFHATAPYGSTTRRPR